MDKYERYEGTPIEKRHYGKAELAEALGISRNTLRREIVKIEPLLEALPLPYSKFAKFLYPVQIELYLRHIGYL